MNKPSFKKVIRRIITALGIIISVGLIPLLIVNITIIFKSYTSPDEVASCLGYKPFIVISDSMNPSIASGDLVLIKETTPGLLNTGDIIAYRIGDAVVTHRIVDIIEKDGARQYITRGDANNVDDSKPVSEFMVEGVFYANIPKLGSAALFMQTPVGMLICIGLPVIFLVGYDIMRRRRFDKEKQK